MAGRAIAHVHSIVRVTWFSAKVGKAQTQVRQGHRLLNLGGGRYRSMRKATEQEAYCHQQDHCGLCKRKLNAPSHAVCYQIPNQRQTELDSAEFRYVATVPDTWKNYGYRRRWTTECLCTCNCAAPASA